MGLPIIPISPGLAKSGGIAGALVLGLSDQLKLPVMSMAGLNPTTGQIIMSEFAFQWWPESITDTIETGWQPKQIPGGSHALMQWGSNGGRTISFEVPITRLMQYEPKGQLFLRADPTNDANKPYNANVNMMIKWLRSFCYPVIDNTATPWEVASPMIAVLYAPGLMLNENGSDWIWAVMTQCDITYKKVVTMNDQSAVSLASASLSFKQIIQNPAESGSADAYAWKYYHPVFAEASPILEGIGITGDLSAAAASHGDVYHTWPVDNDGNIDPSSMTP
jgi:hypothetical protein